MISEIFNLILALIAGMAIGTFFFGGLWFTVRKAVNAKTPAIWFFCSFFLRVSITMVGFYFISLGGNWQHLVIALLGFVIARFIVTYFAKSFEINEHKKKLNHEA
jgi:F1F0 ATPase subunit 2